MAFKLVNDYTLTNKTLFFLRDFCKEIVKSSLRKKQCGNSFINAVTV